MSQSCVSKHVVGIGVLVAVLLCTMPAVADTVVMNGTPDHSGLWFSGSALFDYPPGHVQLAQESLFLPAMNDPNAIVHLTGVHWWGYEVHPADIWWPIVSPSTMRISFVEADGSGTPISFEHQGGTYLGESVPLEYGNAAFLFEYHRPLLLDFRPAEHPEGLGLFIYGVDTSTWAWAESNPDGVHWEWRSTTDPLERSGDLAFYLTGYITVIPEPATFTMIGMGLGGLALRRLRNRG